MKKLLIVLLLGATAGTAAIAFKKVRGKKTEK